MKSCLKCTRTPPPTPATTASQSPSTSGTATPSSRSCAKQVKFCSESIEQVFIADEWDRTPTEPARKLSYEEILELKHLTSSLPRAEQRPEVSAYVPNYLRKVPIHVLPLLPEAASSNTLSPPIPAYSPPVRGINTSPPVTHPPSPPTTPPPPPARPIRMSRFTMPILQLLPTPDPPAPVAPTPSAPAAPKSKLNFSFVPLFSAEEPAVPTKPSPPEPVQEPKAAPPQGNEDSDNHLPTPTSTPALTTCSLASDSDSGPSSPRPPSPPVRIAFSEDGVHFLDAFPVPPSRVPGSSRSTSASRHTSRTSSPARDPRCMFDDAQPVRDPRRMFDRSMSPARDPRRMFDDCSPASTVPGSPRVKKGQDSLDAPNAPAALALRLSSLGLAELSPPALSTSTEASELSTPSSVGSLYPRSAGDSPGPDASTLLAQSGYFHLPQRPTRASQETAAQGAIPQHVRTAFGATHALPESPFVDPMFAMRSAPAATQTMPTKCKPNPADSPCEFLLNEESDDVDSQRHRPAPPPQQQQQQPATRRGPPISPFALRMPAKGAPRRIGTPKPQPPAMTERGRSLRLEALPSPGMGPPSPFFLNSPPPHPAGARASTMRE